MIELFETLHERFGEYGPPVAFSPDSSVLAAWGEAKAVLLWEVNQGRWLPWIPGEHAHWGMDVVIDNPLLEELLRAGRARVWPLARLRNDIRQAEGTLDAGQTGYHLICWRPESVAEVVFPDTQGSRVFSHDGRLMVVAEPSGRVAVYATATLQERCVFQVSQPEDEDKREATAVSRNQKVEAISPDKSLVAVNDSRFLKLPKRYAWSSSLRFWEIGEQGAGVCQVLRMEDQRIDAVTFSPDGSLLAMAANGHVLVYRSPSLGLLAQVGEPNDASIRLAFSPDGKILAAGGFDGDLWFWETETWGLVSTLAAHPDCQDCRLTGQFQSLYDVAWSPDGRLLATSGEERQGKSIKLWLVS